MKGVLAIIRSKSFSNGKVDQKKSFFLKCSAMYNLGKLEAFIK